MVMRVASGGDPGGNGWSASAREMVDWLTPLDWVRSRPDSPASMRVRRSSAASWWRPARGAPDGWSLCFGH